MAYICIFFFILIIFFNGFSAFLGGFSVADFFASYITIPVFGVAWLGFRLYSAKVGNPSGLTPLDQIDLSRGPAAALKDTKYDLGAPGPMMMASSK
jgi:amino acid transporter